MNSLTFNNKKILVILSFFLILFMSTVLSGCDFIVSEPIIQTGNMNIMVFSCNNGVLDASGISGLVKINNTDNNDGSTIGSFVAGTIITVNAQANVGYEFDAWYGDNGLTQELSTNTGYSFVVESSKTVYANFITAQSQEVYYTVTFNSAGGTAVSSIQVLDDSAIGVSMPVNPTKEGYTFGGWYTQANGAGTQVTSSTIITANLTVYAKWIEMAQPAVAPVGSGTSTSPYLISSVGNLLYIAEQTNTNPVYSTGTYFKQTANIDLSGITSWTPIGINSTYYFQGNYDGNGYSITGLTINTTSYQYVGLFGLVKTNGYNITIQNINLVKPNVVASYSSVFVGGLIGATNNSNSSLPYLKVKNIAVTGEVNSTTDKVQGTATSSQAFVGGIIGRSENSIQLIGSYANLDYVQGYTANTVYVGGLIGQVYANTYGSLIQDSFNISSYIRGYATNNSATKYVGGLFGSLYAASSGTGIAATDLKVKSSYNAGQTSSNSIFADSNGTSYVGMIAGYSNYANFGFYEYVSVIDELNYGEYVIYDNTYASSISAIGYVANSGDINYLYGKTRTELQSSIVGFNASGYDQYGDGISGGTNWVFDTNNVIHPSFAFPVQKGVNNSY